MPPVRSFAALGLFVRDNFLAPSEREALAAEMIGGAGTLAGIVAASGVNPSVRRVWEVEVPDAQALLVGMRVSDLRGDLERHFGVRLEEPEAPSYLRYPPGAFYRPHRDRSGNAEASNAQRREVSVVVFVNDSGGPHAFAGGNLRFYGLLGEGPLSDLGLDAEPEAGTLIAFPSTLQHEVTCVERGVRCTIATWFTGLP